MSVLVTQMKESYFGKRGYLSLSDVLNNTSSYVFDACIKVPKKLLKQLPHQWILYYEGTPYALNCIVSSSYNCYGDLQVTIIQKTGVLVSELGEIHSDKPYIGEIYEGKLYTAETLREHIHASLKSLIDASTAPVIKPPVQAQAKRKEHYVPLHELNAERVRLLKARTFG